MNETGLLQANAALSACAFRSWILPIVFGRAKQLNPHSRGTPNTKAVLSGLALLQRAREGALSNATRRVS